MPPLPIARTGTKTIDTWTPVAAPAGSCLGGFFIKALSALPVLPIDYPPTDTYLRDNNGHSGHSQATKGRRENRQRRVRQSSGSTSRCAHTRTWRDPRQDQLVSLSIFDFI